MSQSLQALLEHAERERDEAMVALVQAEDACRHLQQQLDQLLDYRREFESRSPGAGGKAAPIELLRCHQGFAQRLEQALAQQGDLVQSTESRLQSLRQVLLQRETRVAAVRKLVERRLQEQQRNQARLEQKRSDEAAAQRRWHHGANSRPMPH
jgi:flagellar FliJ protein